MKNLPKLREDDAAVIAQLLPVAYPRPLVGKE